MGSLNCELCGVMQLLIMVVNVRILTSSRIRGSALRSVAASGVFIAGIIDLEYSVGYSLYECYNLS